MITTFQNWATQNGAGATVQSGGATATVSQVCTPSCESSTDTSSSGGVTAGAFIGGLIAWIILLAIPVTIACIVVLRRKEFSAAQTETSKTDQKLEQVHYSTGGGGVELNQNAVYKTTKYPDEVIYEQAT